MSIREMGCTHTFALQFQQTINVHYLDLDRYLLKHLSFVLWKLCHAWRLIPKNLWVRKDFCDLRTLTLATGGIIMKLATALLLTTVASIVNGQWILEQEEDDYDAYEDIDGTWLPWWVVFDLSDFAET